jgi:uncharacterized membrane protein
MDLSAAGLIGAFVGLVAGWANYVFIVGIVQRKLRQLDKSESPLERAAFENKLALMRRIILGIDVVVFSVVGYAVGHTIGG